MALHLAPLNNCFLPGESFLKQLINYGDVWVSPDITRRRMRGGSDVSRTAHRTLETKGCVPQVECPERARAMKGHIANNRRVSGFMLSMDDREVF